MATRQPRPLPHDLDATPVHLMVMHDGRVFGRYLASRQECHAADLIVTEGIGTTLWVWKDRYDLVSRECILTPQQAGALAAAYVVLSSEEAMRDFGAYLQSVRRQLASAMKLSDF